MWYSQESDSVITTHISATILEKGCPALFVSGWFMTAVIVVCSTVVVAAKCCGYLWLPTISSETHY